MKSRKASLTEVEWHLSPYEEISGILQKVDFKVDSSSILFKDGVRIYFPISEGYKKQLIEAVGNKVSLFRTDIPDREFIILINNEYINEKATHKIYAEAPLPNSARINKGSIQCWQRNKSKRQSRFSLTY